MRTKGWKTVWQRIVFIAHSGQMTAGNEEHNDAGDNRRARAGPGARACSSRGRRHRTERDEADGAAGHHVLALVAVHPRAVGPLLARRKDGDASGEQQGAEGGGDQGNDDVLLCHGIHSLKTTISIDELYLSILSLPFNTRQRSVTPPLHPEHTPRPRRNSTGAIRVRAGRRCTGRDAAADTSSSLMPTIGRRTAGLSMTPWSHRAYFAITAALSAAHDGVHEGTQRVRQLARLPHLVGVEQLDHAAVLGGGHVRDHGDEARRRRPSSTRSSGRRRPE